MRKTRKYRPAPTPVAIFERFQEIDEETGGHKSTEYVTQRVMNDLGVSHGDVIAALAQFSIKPGKDGDGSQAT